MLKFPEYAGQTGTTRSQPKPRVVKTALQPAVHFGTAVSSADFLGKASGSMWEKAPQLFDPKHLCPTGTPPLWPSQSGRVRRTAPQQPERRLNRRSNGRCEVSLPVCSVDPS
eukprot:s48_g30.t1